VAESDNKSTAIDLGEQDTPYRMFVENMRDGAATLSPTGHIIYANRRLAELLGRSKATVVGSPLSMFLEDGFLVDLTEVHGPLGVGATVELNMIDGDGGTVPVRVDTSSIDVNGERLTCLTVTDLSGQRAQATEIARLSLAQSERLTELDEAQAALIRLGTHDGLTGLPNRGLLVDRITHALSDSKGSATCTAVLFIDLDRFKHINDTRGHPAGDAVLHRVAQELVMIVRPSDTVARLGSDVFVVLSPRVASHQHALDIGTRLLARLAQPGADSDGDERVSASVGIAVSVDGRGSAELLLNEADHAMFHAKSLGGGRVVLFDAALGRRVEQRSAAQHTLQSALDEHRVIVHYQPVIDLTTGHISSFEALGRIAADDGSILPPAEFIPAAEVSGLVVPFGAQVLDMACHEARSWPPPPRPAYPLSVAVNLSARQFEPGDLATLIGQTLDETGLDPECLHLELTETAIIDLRPDVMQQLGGITAMGVEIGLDDFGTGYASLTHLRRLPLTFVKIDQSFVQGLGIDEEDDRIVAAVVDLAANLGMRSIAEGVETTDQLDRLRELGCDEAQGYLFARPMPPGDVAAVVRHAAW
jgi:diguanylate cyclase (GGDEF)-like protein/PAS domain S-box-containing protein